MSTEKKWRKIIRITVGETFREGFSDVRDMNITIASPQTHKRETIFEVGTKSLVDGLEKVNLGALVEPYVDAQRLLLDILKTEAFAGTAMHGRINNALAALTNATKL
jgi:hypothetical protein